MMSFTLIPLGIIGSTCSWCGTCTFNRNAPGDSIISTSAPSRSARAEMLRAFTPNPFAIVSKSGYGG